MNYTNVDRILDTYPLVSSMTAVSSLALATFIRDAEAEIDGRLSKLYPVPVPGGPPLLTAIATDLAMYRLLSRRTFTQERTKLSEWVDKFGTEPRDMLDRLAKGEASLVDSAGVIIPGRTDIAEVWTNKIDYHPTFDEHGGFDQVQDDVKIEDLDDERDLR